MRKLRNEELNRLTVEEYKKELKIHLVVVLDNIRSMNNIGSVFRTGDAFKIEEIILCGITAIPPNKEIHKTALGSTESVSWRYLEETSDAILELRNKGYMIIAVEQAEESISLFNLELRKNEKYAVIFGHEVKGVQQEIVNSSDLVTEIPQFGTKHSLNISVCAGIVIWEFFKKLSN